MHNFCTTLLTMVQARFRCLFLKILLKQLQYYPVHRTVSQDRGSERATMIHVYLDYKNTWYTDMGDEEG